MLLCSGWFRARGTPLRLVVLDADSRQPVACRIHLKNAAGRAMRGGKLPFWRDHFVCPGTVELDLEPGDYAYELDRGPEYLVRTGKVTVVESSRQVITNRIQRLVNLSREGWWSGELHVHRPVADIELLMQAEDLHVAPVVTWWNNRNPWTNGTPSNPLVRFDDNRFYHLMGGEDERGGGALLYFNLPRPLAITVAAREFPSPMKFLAEARREAHAWVDIEKPFWYDAPVWLASGQVDSIGIAHNHMHRGGVLPNEAWGRPRDQQRFPDPQGNGFWTQEIYYHALNCGLRLPPSAGSASGVLPNPVGYNRAYVRVEGDLSYEVWFAGLKAGRVFVSNGPLLRCRANGQWPGHVFTIRNGNTLEVEMTATLVSRDPIAAIEIVRDGKVAMTIRGPEWKQTGALGTIRFEDNGWFLVRAMADVPDTFRFASTGPFYVEKHPETRRISRASAQFFLDWVRERMNLIKLEDSREREEVLQHHRMAERFWQAKLDQANAD